ncbi:MAG: hypothetical protein ACYCYF_10250, partial [Anaerolineae bacterium]
FGTSGADTGDRGWATLPVPNQSGKCGADALGSWIVGGYDGVVGANVCVPGADGTKTDVVTSVGAFMSSNEYKANPNKYILLYDPEQVGLRKDECDVTVGEINMAGCEENAYFLVVDFGCIRVQGWTTDFEICEIGTSTPTESASSHTKPMSSMPPRCARAVTRLVQVHQCLSRRSRGALLLPAS